MSLLKPLLLRHALSSPSCEISALQFVGEKSSKTCELKAPLKKAPAVWAFFFFFFIFLSCFYPLNPTQIIIWTMLLTNETLRWIFCSTIYGKWVIFVQLLTIMIFSLKEWIFRSFHHFINICNTQNLHSMRKRV